MDKPNLNQLWETFIRIPTQDDTIVISDIYDTIRSKIHPLVSSLRKDGVISWYCFLIHNRHSGVPTFEEDEDPYFHVRFELVKKKNPDDFLPKYCVMTRKIRREAVESITGVDKSLLKNGSIEDAWRIIGEQAEWLLDLLSIHKEDGDIPPDQIGQFLHFYANMTCVAVR